MPNSSTAPIAPALKIAPTPETSKRPTIEVGRPIAAIIADLSKPIEDRHLKSKTIKGNDITYIPWYFAIKYLDFYAPGWTYEVRHLTPIAGAVIVTVRISIPCAEGIVFREATGIEDEDTPGYGDTSSNAESMALRRAASKFGLALYLYDKERAKSYMKTPNASKSGARNNQPPWD